MEATSDKILNYSIFVGIFAAISVNKWMIRQQKLLQN